MSTAITPFEGLISGPQELRRASVQCPPESQGKSSLQKDDSLFRVMIVGPVHRIHIEDEQRRNEHMLDVLLRKNQRQK